MWQYANSVDEQGMKKQRRVVLLHSEEQVKQKESISKACKMSRDEAVRGVVLLQ
jgi:hypothetical protein